MTLPLQQPLLPLLIATIERAGSDNVGYFGGLYEGGYHIQQYPEELARLICLLASRQPFRWSLEIGIASGGTTRSIREWVTVENTVVIDDGAHAKFPVWECENRHTIANLHEFRGNSHSVEAAAFLDQFVQPFDLVGIDGDHSFEGVKADWELVQPHLAPQALVWFHDIVACSGVAELWQHLKQSYHVLLETTGLGIGVLCYQPFR